MKKCEKLQSSDEIWSQNMIQTDSKMNVESCIVRFHGLSKNGR